MNVIRYAALAATCLCAGQASAATQFLTRSAFMDAVGPTKVETFDNRPLRGFAASNTNFGDFRTSMTAQYGIGAGNTFYAPNATRFFWASFERGKSMTFTFATAIKAFGADVAQLNDNADLIKVTVAGQTFDTGLNPAFIGYVSDTAFTTVTLTFPTAPPGISNDIFGMDNFTYGSMLAAVPEPATWATMLLGVGMIGAGARYRRKKAVTRFA